MDIRETAIRNYIMGLHAYEIHDILCNIADYDGTFLDIIWHPMDELNDVLSDYSPIDILEMAHFGNFDPTDSWFRFDGYENLESADTSKMDMEAYALIDELVDYCVNAHVGATENVVLDELIEKEF